MNNPDIIPVDLKHLLKLLETQKQQSDALYDLVWAINELRKSQDKKLISKPTKLTVIK